MYLARVRVRLPVTGENSRVDLSSFIARSGGGVEDLVTAAWESLARVGSFAFLVAFCFRDVEYGGRL